MALFRDRRDAGRRLSLELSDYVDREDLIVLALPRGGVPVAYEVARALHAPLDVFLVRKLGLPGHEELAMGANDDVVRALNISPAIIDAVAEREQLELERRERTYRRNRPSPQLAGKTVILIDDGLATGSSMRAAVVGLRAQHPARIVIAVPTAAVETCESLEGEVEDVICATTPEPFFGVGTWYEDFSQTTDEEVYELLAEAADQPHGG